MPWEQTWCWLVLRSLMTEEGLGREPHVEGMGPQAAQPGPEEPLKVTVGAVGETKQGQVWISTQGTRITLLHLCGCEPMVRLSPQGQGLPPPHVSLRSSRRQRSNC